MLRYIYTGALGPQRPDIEAITVFCVYSELIMYTVLCSTVVLTVFCVHSDLIMYSIVFLTVFCVHSDLIMYSTV